MENEKKTSTRLQLFKKQKQLLDTFLQTGAITERQYRKCLGDLPVKMKIAPDEEKHL